MRYQPARATKEVAAETRSFRKVPSVLDERITKFSQLLVLSRIRFPSSSVACYCCLIPLNGYWLILAGFSKKFRDAFLYVAKVCHLVTV